MGRHTTGSPPHDGTDGRGPDDDGPTTGRPRPLAFSGPVTDPVLLDAVQEELRRARAADRPQVDRRPADSAPFPLDVPQDEPPPELPGQRVPDTTADPIGVSWALLLLVLGVGTAAAAVLSVLAYYRR